MLDSKALMEGASIPSVDPADLKRCWTFMSTEGKKHGPTSSISVKFLTPLVSPGADMIALLARSAMISTLVQLGGIEQCTHGDSLSDIVFQEVATFPLPNGIQQFDPNDLVSILQRASG